MDAAIPALPVFRRRGRSSGVPSPACGSGHGRQRPPRLPVADHLLEAADGRLSPGADGVAGCLLPSRSAVLGDELQMAVPLRGRSCPRFQPRSGWNGSVGVVSAVSLDTALERGGTMMVAAGWRVATAAETLSWSQAPSAVNDVTEAAIWSSKGTTWEPSSTSLRVSDAATIWPVSASMPMCSVRQDRRVLAPCFSISHSPAPQSFRPVLSTSRCKGSPSRRDRGRGTSSVAARRLSVVWSGTAKARLRRPMMGPCCTDPTSGAWNRPGVAGHPDLTSDIHLAVQAEPGPPSPHSQAEAQGHELGGAGEWLVEKHGTKTRRSWRKLHLGMDADTGQIVAAALTTKEVDDGAEVGPLLDQVVGPVASFTGDGAYDQRSVSTAIARRHPEAAIIVPPRSTAVPSEAAETAPTQRDRHLQFIAGCGRAAWQRTSGYTMRVRAKAAIGRFKQVIGDGLRSRTDQRRATEVDVAVHALNRMLERGRPNSVRIA